MKIIRTLLFGILLGAFLPGCGTAAQPTVAPFAESMKGYELYSWQEGDQWKFSLLIGTNRDKTLEEIKSADVVLADVDALLATLEKSRQDNMSPGRPKKRYPFHPRISAARLSKSAKTRV